MLIFGLGNPGRDYDGTRHNVGFEVINKLAYDNNIDICRMKRRSFIGEGFIGSQKCVLIKPQTFMNLSGEAVRENIQFYKEPLENIIIIYDDTSLKLGEIRIRAQGSSGGHNGIKNILYHLGTDVFPRVRVGIGEKPSGWDLADYVLSRFKKDEIDDIVTGITKAGEAVEILIREGLSEAMNKYNKINKVKKPNMDKQIPEEGEKQTE